MFLLFGAFIAGMLTVLAPCVLPLLPVVIGGSVAGDSKDKKRPLIIAAALAISLFAFTLLLKATTLLINIPPNTTSYLSGALVIALGVVMLVPSLYARLMVQLHIEQSAQQVLGKGYSDKRRFIGPALTGAALGPVFSSCSPVYAYILATVLPASFAQAMVYVVSYILGLSLVLLGVGYYGQRFIGKIRFAANPKGWFQRVIAIIFILVGISIFTGYDKTFQVYVSEHTPFNFDGLSSHLLPSAKNKITSDNLFNVQPFAAPEFTGIQTWINSQPLTMSQLRGKVVLVDFWTYSCINCIRNNPYIEKWYQTYKDDGFVVVGVHAPEFSFEQVPTNVQKAVSQQHLTYPVAMDNNLATWNAFANQSWPASYLINAQGQVVRIHDGEGDYAQEEQAIRQLLSENGAKLPQSPTVSGNVAVPISESQTPETYFGSNRESNFLGSPSVGQNGLQVFSPASDLPRDSWTLGGSWDVSGEYITARGNSSLSFHIGAKDVYVVAGGSSSAKIGVKLNGQPISDTANAGDDVQNSAITMDGARLYHVVHFNSFSQGTITLTVPDGVQLNTFTFGS